MELAAEDMALIEMFRRSAAARRQDAQLAEEDQRFRDDQKERRERKKREDRDAEQFEEMMMATAEQVAAFTHQLDDYDTATVHALMENQRALDEFRHRREQMEAQAYRLPDGRMVFKSEDGTRVYDRKGTELAHETVHPDTIPDTAPRWEAIKRITDSETKLQHERRDLHTFQQRLDETREALGKGDITGDALAKMDADLKRDMPDGVRAHVPGAASSPRVLEINAPSVMPGTYKFVATSPEAPAGP